MPTIPGNNPSGGAGNPITFELPNLDPGGFFSPPALGTDPTTVVPSRIEPGLTPPDGGQEFVQSKFPWASLFDFAGNIAGSLINPQAAGQIDTSAYYQAQLAQVEARRQQSQTLLTVVIVAVVGFFAFKMLKK